MDIIYFVAGVTFTLLIGSLGTWFGFWVASKRVSYDLDKIEHKTKEKEIKPQLSPTAGPVRPKPAAQVKLEKEGRGDETEALKRAIL